MDKEDVVHIHNGILFTHKKGMKLGHLQRCGWPKNYHIEWSKSEREKCHISMLICGIEKNGMGYLICKTEIET